MSILRRKLEELEEEEVSISPEVNSKLWENGVERPPARLEVEVVDTDSGLRAVLPGEEAESKPSETEETEDEEEDDSEKETEQESGEDYSEIVSGTVSDAKDELQELEDPDWESALEAEKEGKDRKTLKEFIESKM